MRKSKIYLIRHGETEWSKNGNHTGLTDIPLTADGIKQAELVTQKVQGIQFDEVYTSPLARAHATCEIAGLLEKAHVSDLLLEWDYGVYEGKKTVEIRKENPEWDIFIDGAPQGESVDDIFQRAEAFLHQLDMNNSTIAVFSSGHFLRALTAAFLGVPLSFGRHLQLSTASLSIVSFHRNTPVIDIWNN